MMHPVYLFFEFGGGEILLIMIVALLLFGGDKLPELARGIGKGIRDFKDASEGVKREIQNQIDNYEDKRTEEKKAAETPVNEQPVAEHKVAEPVIHPEPEAVQNHVPNTMTYNDNPNVAGSNTDVVHDMVEQKRAEDLELVKPTAEPEKEQHS